MKKLMMALAVVACATVVNAASFNWATSGTNAAKTFYGSDGTSTIAGTTVYLMDAATVSQSALITALRDGGSFTDYASVTSQTLDSNSRLVAKEFSYGEAGTTYNFYMAIVDGDNLFVSASKEVYGQLSDTVAIQFSGVKTATQSTFGDAAYSTAGWYSTAAVPEPTSGLLMLLGMAGLALRRRRA